MLNAAEYRWRALAGFFIYVSPSFFFYGNANEIPPLSYRLCHCHCPCPYHCLCPCLSLSAMIKFADLRSISNRRSHFLSCFLYCSLSNSLTCSLSCSLSICLSCKFSVSHANSDGIDSQVIVRLPLNLFYMKICFDPFSLSSIIQILIVFSVSSFPFRLFSPRKLS